MDALPTAGVERSPADALASSRPSARTVLVAGCGGLLGRELVRQLVAAGFVVRGVDRNGGSTAAAVPVPQRCADLLEPQACADLCRGVQTVIHAAAVQYHDRVPRWRRERFFQQNVRIAQNLVAAVRRAGVRHLIMVSSDMVYGLPRGRPWLEDDPPAPIGPYGRSKLQAEEVCRQVASDGICVTILRPRLILGPGRVGVLRYLFDRVRSGRAIPIVGSPRCRYQMVSVRDVAAACLLALERGVAGTFNLGSDDPPGVGQLIAALCERAGSCSRIVRVPRRMAHAALGVLDAVRCGPLAAEQFRLTGRDCVVDTTRARKHLGWRPQDSDIEMLYQAYAAYVQRDAERPPRTVKRAAASLELPLAAPPARPVGARGRWPL